MSLYGRLIVVLVRAWLAVLRGRRLTPDSTARTPFRVWPHDLDLNGHVNNGRYGTMMDLGRVDLMARTGTLGPMVRARMLPVVTAQHLLYRRPLKPFQAFRIDTELIGWDERFVYVEQRFVRNGRLHARGIMQSLFLGPRGKVPTAELVGVLGLRGERPVPAEVLALFPPPPPEPALQGGDFAESGAKGGPEPEPERRAA